MLVNCATPSCSSLQNLKTHMKVHHMRQSQTQTDELSLVDKSSQSDESEKVQDLCAVKTFLVYQCFYCDLKIKSDEHLSGHKKECHEKLNFLKKVPKPKMSRIGFPPTRDG